MLGSNSRLNNRGNYHIIGFYRGYIGIMGKEKKMETTIVYWGYIGVMEKNMETTMVYMDYIGVI